MQVAARPCCRNLCRGSHLVHTIPPGDRPAAAAPLRPSTKQPRLSARPPLSHCTESEFLDDVCTYLSERKGTLLMLTCSARTVGAGMQRGWPAICSEVRPSACCSDGESCSVSPPGKAMNRDTFPEAVLNGQQLDLFALYREVATRGGFKCAAYIPPCHHRVIFWVSIPRAHMCPAPLFTGPPGVSACIICAHAQMS